MGIVEEVGGMIVDCVQWYKVVCIGVRWGAGDKMVREG